MIDRLPCPITGCPHPHSGSGNHFSSKSTLLCHLCPPDHQPTFHLADHSICSTARLPIPVFRNLFFGPKKPFLPGFLRIFFSCVFWRNFSQERGFGEVAGIPVFFVFTGFFRRNSRGTGIPVFTRNPPDSGGFLFSPKATGSGQRLKKALC